jgi:phytoene synthase
MDSSMLETAKLDLQEGSKSFSLASLFFRQDQKAAARLLYAWCRYCDDKIDQSSGEDSLRTLDAIRAETRRALDGTPSARHPWLALATVASRYRIPHSYFYDCLNGFAQDVHFQQPQTERELAVYCYRVAGTIGLMMCSVMGISAPAALDHAVALGRAMQMTNIARDVKEDFLNNRIYLPQTWISLEGVDPRRLLDEDQAEAVTRVVRHLLCEAELLYQKGKSGLRYLPFRAAWAVAIALFVYRDIALILTKHPQLCLQRRVITSPFKKWICVLKATLLMARLIPARMLVGWQPLETIEVWRET